MAYDPVTVKSIEAVGDRIIVRDMKFESRLSNGGIILPSDDMQAQGVRPRWAQVYAVGPSQTDVQVGQWVCVAHGRWTRGVRIKVEDTGETIVIRRVDPNDILLVSDTEHADETIGRGL